MTGTCGTRRTDAASSTPNRHEARLTTCVERPSPGTPGLSTHEMKQATEGFGPASTSGGTVVP